MPQHLRRIFKMMKQIGQYHDIVTMRCIEMLCPRVMDDQTRPETLPQQSHVVVSRLEHVHISNFQEQFRHLSRRRATLQNVPPRHLPRDQPTSEAAYYTVEVSGGIIAFGDTLQSIAICVGFPVYHDPPLAVRPGRFS